MRVYMVGGAVRDKILGRKVYERDFLVTGATSKRMKEAGYRQVGADFPVFLHPQTGEEYALARTERKTGRGHAGFAFYAGEEVTVEQDLMRRDFTANSMAIDMQTGELVDPYGGRADCGNRLLRHVSDAFSEDPLRVLRAARLAAELNFDVCEHTASLARDMSAAGKLGELSAERIWREMKRGLTSDNQVRFVHELRVVGALAAILPEVDKLLIEPTASRSQTLAVLDIAELNKWGLSVMLGCLLHELGANSDGQKSRDGCSTIASKICTRLRMPAKLRGEVVAAVRDYRTVLGLHKSDAQEVLALIERTGALRSTNKLECLHGVCDCVFAADPNVDNFVLHPNRALVAHALRVAAGAPVAAAAKKARDPGTAVHAVRLEALRTANLFC